MEFREGRVSGTSNLGYKIIKDGDLVLSPQNLWLGNININNIGKGLVSPSYKTFEFRNIDSSFINPQLRTQKMLEEYKNSSTQGASVVRRNLEIDSFYQIKIFVPTITEQEEIGSFFKQLDNTITLQQHKLDQLNTLKKGLLQKMFADKKHPQPELRFKGFSGDWEQQKSEKIFKERKEKSDNKQLLSVSINNGVTLFDETGRKNNSSKDKHNYRLVLPGDIAYNSMRMWQGALGVSNLEGIVSPAYTVITPKQNEEAYFYYYMFKRKSSLDTFQRHSQGLTSDTWNLKFPLFKSIIFYTTNAKEQTRIASLLLKLDSVITHQQKQIDKLNSLKKSLLQNMFI